jgi:hypothetical protein
MLAKQYFSSQIPTDQSPEKQLQQMTDYAIEQIEDDESSKFV